MKPLITQGAMLKCSFGNAPVPLMVLPDKGVKAVLPAATGADHIPFVNILPFGMCCNPANPMVAAATAAAFGVLTPVVCIPCTPVEWSGVCPKVRIKGKEVLTPDSRLKCLYGGEIQIVTPTQMTVLV